MAEREAQNLQEYQNLEQPQKILKHLIEMLPDATPLILCHNQEWVNSFHEFLQGWLEPMIVR